MTRIQLSELYIELDRDEIATLVDTGVVEQTEDGCEVTILAEEMENNLTVVNQDVLKKLIAMAQNFNKDSANEHFDVTGYEIHEVARDLYPDEDNV